MLSFSIRTDENTDTMNLIFVLRRSFAQAAKYERVLIWRTLSLETDSGNERVKSCVC